jgi:hypothetical protein
MAKQMKWHDVRLLSFDLQTVEFAYAQVGFCPSYILFDLIFCTGLRCIHLLRGSTFIHGWQF